MPSQTLPIFTQAEVESHKSAKSCYVTVGRNVYDMTDFLDAHPGGPELILDWAGKDITDILKDEVSHTHTESAYEMLDESLVGFLAVGKQTNGSADGQATSTAIEGEKLADGTYPVHPRTGMSSAEDLSRETDIDKDFKTHKFLDLNRPLLMQVWRGGFTKEFYLDQVHRPRHYKGGASAPLFGNFLEPISLTPWWVVPIIWLPFVSYKAYASALGLDVSQVVGSWFLGLALWTLIEYLMHRFLFHLDALVPDNRVGISLHFLLHGLHHYVPMDRYRLVMPPTLFLVLLTPFLKLARIVFFWNQFVGEGVVSGAVFGYICYDLTHYFLHHRNLPLWYKQLKKHHLEHHFLDFENGFGVSNRFWDWVFGTELNSPPSYSKST